MSTTSLDYLLHRLVLVLVLVLVLATSTLACDGQPSYDGGGDPDPRVCAANWQVIFSPEQSALPSAPEVIRWRDGHLFTTPLGGRPLRILSFPDRGGPVTALLEDVAIPSVWTEDDRLLYLAKGEPVQTVAALLPAVSLRSTPVTGGPSDVVLTTQVADSDLYRILQGWALDRDALYWTMLDTAITDSPWSLWRASRDGTGDQQLASLSSAIGWPDVVKPVGDDLLVFPSPRSFGNQIVAVPKVGGQPRSLPGWPGEKILGVSDDGTVLWQRHLGGDATQKRGEHFQVGRLRPGADAVEPFWHGKPPWAVPLAAWDDGLGGFYVSTWEWGTDDVIHTTIWTLDADGHAQRLACDPQARTSIRAAAVAPDAIHVVVRYSSDYWEVVRIDRGGPA